MTTSAIVPAGSKVYRHSSVNHSSRKCCIIIIICFYWRSVCIFHGYKMVSYSSGLCSHNIKTSPKKIILNKFKIISLGSPFYLKILLRSLKIPLIIGSLQEVLKIIPFSKVVFDALHEFQFNTGINLSILPTPCSMRSRSFILTKIYVVIVLAY